MSDDPAKPPAGPAEPGNDDEARKAAELAEIGRVAGGVAHDLNNLLAIILGQADLITEALWERDPLRQEVEQIRAAANRAVALARRLSPAGKRNPARPRVTDLDSVPRPPPSKDRETVFLVEDEGILRSVLRMVLAREGYQVHEAPDGLVALERIRAYPGPIDLLVTDVGMPRLGGVELAGLVAGLRPGIRVLFLSGHSDEKVELDRAFPAGAPVLQKPVTREVLLAEVRAVLDRGPGPREGNGVDRAKAQALTPRRSPS